VSPRRCRLTELDSAPRAVERRERRVTAEASEMVTVPRAELDALRAEVRRLRREVGRSIARARIEADPGPGDGSLTMSRSELAEAWGISE
jgi:ATP/maltotriose-dependent transcriptional regulator MalT